MSENNINHPREIRRGDVFYIESIYQTTGSEQRAGRPAVIVSNDINNRNSEVVEVVYLTTKPKSPLPTHVTINVGEIESTVLCEQVSNVSTERVGTYKCTCTEEEMSRIDAALMVSLGLNKYANISGSAQKEEAALKQEPTDEEKLIRVQAKLEVYKTLYEELLEKIAVIKER